MEFITEYNKNYGRMKKDVQIRWYILTRMEIEVFLSYFIDLI